MLAAEPREIKKRKITRNRSINTCTSCRAMKTKCVYESPAGCVRCLSMNVECLSVEPQESNSVDQRYETAPINIFIELEQSLKFRLASLENSVEQILSALSELSGKLKNTTTTYSNSSSVPNGCAVGSGQRTSELQFANESAPESNLPVLTTENSMDSPVGVYRKLQDKMFGLKSDLSHNIYNLGDVVSCGYITESQSRDLIIEFVRHYGSWLDISSTEVFEGVQTKSPIMFCTMCLLAARYSPSTDLRTVKSMYDLTRNILGLTLLNCSDLYLETLDSVFLLAGWAPTLQSDIPIDSWMISSSGLNHCLMFPKVLTSIKTPGELSTPEDFQWKRAWNRLALMHLQWSVGYFRPCAIDISLFELSKTVLNSSSTTDTDCRIVSEIDLYKLILEITASPDSSRLIKLECPEIETWKNEWVSSSKNFGNIFGTRYDFAYLVRYRTYLSHKNESVTPAECLSKHYALMAAIHHCLCVLEVFWHDPGYDHFISDVPDHYYFIVMYSTVTLSEAITLFSRKYGDANLETNFNQSLEEFRRIVRKDKVFLGFDNQEFPVQISIDIIKMAVVNVHNKFRRLSFNYGDILHRFSEILSKLIGQFPFPVQTSLQPIEFPQDYYKTMNIVEPFEVNYPLDYLELFRSTFPGGCLTLDDLATES